MLLYMLLRHLISVVGEIDSFIFALMAAHLLLISTASSANVYMNIILEYYSLELILLSNSLKFTLFCTQRQFKFVVSDHP